MEGGGNTQSGIKHQRTHSAAPRCWVKIKFVGRGDVGGFGRGIDRGSDATGNVDSALEFEPVIASIQRFDTAPETLAGAIRRKRSTNGASKENAESGEWCRWVSAEAYAI